MRGDQLLALTWLEKLSAIDPENANLKKVKNVLFSKGLPKISSTPFQCNPDQKAQGAFVKK